MLQSRTEQEMKPNTQYLEFGQIYRAKSKQKMCVCVRTCIFFVCEIVNDVMMEEGILIVRQITMRLAYSCPPHTPTDTHTASSSSQREKGS